MIFKCKKAPLKFSHYASNYPLPPGKNGLAQALPFQICCQTN